MLATFLLKGCFPWVVALSSEQFVLNKYGSSIPLGLGETTTVQVPRTFGLVILSNVIASSIVVVGLLAGRVGEARKKYNVPLPDMYATGKDENAKKFNCVQRGHQQALETFPTYLALSLIGGLRHPIVTSLLGVLYCVSRVKWADGYREDPEKRYTHSSLGKHIWTPILGTLVASISTAAGIMGLF